MTADRVWTRGDMADAHDAYLAGYGTNGGQGLALALASIGLGGEPLRVAVPAYWAKADRPEAARVREGSKLSIGKADAMLDAIARAGGKVSKSDGGAWTVEALVAALNATGRSGFSNAANALFGVGDAGGGLGFGPLRDKISVAYCANPYPEGPMHLIGLGSVAHSDLAAVCDVLNAERVPLPGGPRSAGGTATIASVERYAAATGERCNGLCLCCPRCDAAADAAERARAKAAAPKVDPYDAFAVNALNTAGRGDLGSVGETTRAGAEAHARLRLATARSCAANLARDITELERALAEHGREGDGGAR